jgi:hypothetical protein
MTSDSSPSGSPAGHFWDVARALGRDDLGVAEGTLMGGACMRVDGDFLAMYYAKESAMIVKLNEARVNTLIADGVARPFAPAKKVFREWAAIPAEHSDKWPELMREGIELARS